MWNLKTIEKEADLLAEALAMRGLKLEAEIEELRGLISARRRLTQERDELNRERNLMARGARPGHTPSDAARAARAKTNRLGEDIRGIDALIERIVGQLPNRPHSSVPFGVSSEDNTVVQAWGEPRKFDFTPRDHLEIGQRLGILDLERGAKVAGSGFPSFRDEGALLSRQLINFFLDHHRRRGYTEIEPPYVCNREAYFGTGQLPRFEQELYWTEDGALALVPTAEVPLTNLHAKEVLNEDCLTISYTAYTPCFRREAGAYGRDTRGIIRVHQFDKVELVKFARPEDSYNELESMVEDAGSVLRVLGIPHRQVLLCTGDLGFSAAKTYDLEAWFPSQNRYREISSVSNCEDFQARRAGIRFRRRGGSVELAHTLNGSGVAVGRAWAAILENFQQPDGSVQTPESLVPYMHGLRAILPA